MYGPRSESVGLADSPSSGPRLRKKLTSGLMISSSLGSALEAVPLTLLRVRVRVFSISLSFLMGTCTALRGRISAGKGVKFVWRFFGRLVCGNKRIGWA